MLVSQPIPNLIQGISQQPDSLRLATQGQAQDNCYSSVVEGLGPRKPTKHIAKIFSGSIGNVFNHVINRDATHRYNVVIRNGAISVTTLAGVDQPVSTPDGVGYITDTNPRDHFRAVTIADYTFILNKEKIPAMDAAVSADRGAEGLVFVKQGAYGSVYQVFIDGVQRATYTTSTTSVADLATDNIASQLATQLVANLGGSWTVQRIGSVIWVKRNDAATFQLSVWDSQGGASMQCFKDVTQTFSALPAMAPQGFVIGVNASPGQQEQYAYYVEFNCNSAGATFAEGTWTECVNQGLQNSFDASTMPHALIDNNDGTFTFQEIEWEPRLVGDEDSNPEPSFIGAAINDIYFFKNRLALLSDENTVLSEIGQYFNFWCTTAATLIDSDMIDTSAHSTKVSILRHAIPFNTQCLLFSDQTQFIMQGAPLTQKSIQIDKTTDFENNITVKPVAAGRTVYFVTNKDQYHGLREYYVDPASGVVNDAVDVGGHVPSYIPAGAFKLSVSTTEDVVCLATTGDPDALYFYKYYWEGEQKLQSAWFRWTFGTNAQVLGHEFIETTLYLVIQRGDGVYIESVSVAPGQVDDFVDYVTHIDRRITDDECTSVTYDAVTNRTTFTLPYIPDDAVSIVTRQTSPAATLAPGRILPVLSAVTNTVVIKGDHTATPVWIGNMYAKSYTFSHFFIREQTKTGGTTINNSGRLQIRTLTLVADRTGYVTVKVTPQYRDTSTYLFTGRIIGDGANLINEVALVSGKKRVMVMAKNDGVTITIYSDSFLPFRIMSAEWEGEFTARSQRI